MRHRTLLSGQAQMKHMLTSLNGCRRRAENKKGREIPAFLY
jgi:hypothetical protein